MTPQSADLLLSLGRALKEGFMKNFSMGISLGTEPGGRSSFRSVELMPEEEMRL